MSSMKFNEYRDLEWSFGLVASHIKPIADRKIKDDLHTIEYIMSVLRSYAKTFEDTPVEEHDEVLKGLYQALYR